ncbi:MAG: peptide-methionine (S)-S-oxide reductase [Gallionella sp.]
MKMQSTSKKNIPPADKIQQAKFSVRVRQVRQTRLKPSPACFRHHYLPPHCPTAIRVIARKFHTAYFLTNTITGNGCLSILRRFGSLAFPHASCARLSIPGIPWHIIQWSNNRSAIFYLGEEQKHTAEEVIRTVDASGEWGAQVVTEAVPFREFYRAEEYHQKYLIKNPGGYTCHYMWSFKPGEGK